MPSRDELETGLREMLRDLPPHDDRARRSTLEAVPTTPQRRYRWLPALPIRGAGRMGPAYTGLGAVVLVSVAAIGLVLTTLDSNEPGTTTPDLRPPQSFEGTFVCGPEQAPQDTTVTDIVLEDSTGRLIEDRGAAYTLRIESISDPRLDGALTDRIDTDRYGAGADALRVSALTWMIGNDDGAWTTSFMSFLTEPTDWSTATTRWEGSGDYAGLVALMQLDYDPAIAGSSCGWHVEGLVAPTARLETEPQPVPSLRPTSTNDIAGS